MAHPHRGLAGRPEREFNGPVAAGRSSYRDGLAALGADFAGVDGDEQDAPPRRRSASSSALLYDARVRRRVRRARVRRQPRRRAAGRAIGFPGDVQPRGYTDDEVTRP